MKVILRQTFEGLGSIGEQIEVKSGYARNFLIPRNIVMPVTRGNLKVLNEEKKREEQRKNKARKTAEQMAKTLEKVSLTATVTVGEEDRVFGAVTSQTIADLLKEQNVIIDRKKIDLQEPIKALGYYTISIKLHTEVEAKLKLWVVKE